MAKNLRNKSYGLESNRVIDIMEADYISKWGHPLSDQGGYIDQLLFKGLTKNQIISAFIERYPNHKKPQNRVQRHLNHLRDGHKVDLESYLGKSSSTLSGRHLDTPEFSIPKKVDVEYAESQLRRFPGEVVIIEAVLNQVEVNFTKAGKILKENWHEITRRNIEIWFRKKE